MNHSKKHDQLHNFEKKRALTVGSLCSADNLCLQLAKKTMNPSLQNIANFGFCCLLLHYLFIAKNRKTAPPTLKLLHIDSLLTN